MTNLMTLQSLRGFPYQQEPVADAADFYPSVPQDGAWKAPQDFDMSGAPGQFNLNSFQQCQPPHNNHNDKNTNSEHPCNMSNTDAQQQAYAQNASRPGANLTLTTSQQHPSQSMFTPTNMQFDTQNVATISPMQTRFDHDGMSTIPTMSTTTYAFAPTQTQTSSPAQSATFPQELQYPSSKCRHDSMQASHTITQSSPTSSQSSACGGRRRSGTAEPGSARAIYLEKNRKAASKCRSKQKLQQEELVETAREVERRNRALKAEVEFLRSSVRDLMEVVGHHSECPDGRLRSYVQREADRLAVHGVRGNMQQQQHVGASAANAPSSDHASPQDPSMPNQG